MQSKKKQAKRPAEQPLAAVPLSGVRSSMRKAYLESVEDGFVCFDDISVLICQLGFSRYWHRSSAEEGFAWLRRHIPLSTQESAIVAGMSQTGIFRGAQKST